MRGMVVAAAAAVVAAGLWLPGEAAQPVPDAAAGTATATAARGDLISFAQYRDWRNAFVARRRGELAAELAAAGLPAARRDRLEQVKAYYDWLAGLPTADRDRRYRDRFARIDSDHDGTMDPAERAAWRQRRRAFYRRAAAPRQQQQASAAPPQ